ncbi:MAG: class I SAM-dependent methyltransferase [Clostridia bacterium]|nr:class I SAM-dependent methyltransferase [Clostridia bacterium]
MFDYTKINSETWDLWAKDGCEWTLPITHEEYKKTNAENFIVYLTPCIPVPREWFGDLKGKKVLGLASGGGQQMPVLSKLGAECTVFDYSDRQLDAEKMIAEREGYGINIVKGDMSKLLPFEDESFDLIFHPVSNVYVENVYHIWNECYRILKKGGRLLSGLDNGISFLFDENDPLKVVNPLPFNPLKMPKERLDAMIANGDGVQFSHTLDEQIGGQLKAGFILKDLYEDRDREGGSEIGKYYPQYIATLAVK